MDYTLTLQELEEYDWQQACLEMEAINLKEVKATHNKLLEEITRAEPKWVKERRLEYLDRLTGEIAREMLPFMEVVEMVDASKEMWFAETIEEQELELRFKKLRRIDYEKNLWNLSEFIVDTNEVNERDIEAAKDIPIDNFIQFDRAGFAKCLWHDEKTSSMKYYKNNNKIHCFGCQFNGDVIEVVRKLYNVGFLEAVRFLAKRGGI